MKRVLASLGILFGLAALSNAHGLRELAGSITNPYGTAIADAKVMAVEAGTGFERSAICGAEGFYASPSLRPAQFRFNVDAVVFRSFSAANISLRADQCATQGNSVSPRLF